MSSLTMVMGLLFCPVLVGMFNFILVLSLSMERFVVKCAELHRSTAEFSMTGEDEWRALDDDAFVAIDRE